MGVGWESEVAAQIQHPPSFSHLDLPTLLSPQQMTLTVSALSMAAVAAASSAAVPAAPLLSAMVGNGLFAAKTMEWRVSNSEFFFLLLEQRGHLGQTQRGCRCVERLHLSTPAVCRRAQRAARR